MAKKTFEIESRHIPVVKDSYIAELLYMVINSEFADDADSDNDFDVNIVSDVARFSETVAYDASEEVNTDHLGSAITGTVVAAVFTGGPGTWTVDQFKGYRCFAYASGAESAGAWHEIISNAVGTITSATSFAAGTNRIKLQSRAIRNSIQVIPQSGFYGSFYKHKITKKIPTTGIFKLFDVNYNFIPTKVDAEFLAAMGSITNAWE